MSDLFIQTGLRLLPSIRAGDLESCEKVVVAQMQSLPRSPFDIAATLAISNDPGDAARHFDRFFRAEAQRFKLAAAYTEMNDFDINPRRWYCDLFAYSSYGGHDDYEWLCNWQSTRSEQYVVKGLETLQAIYASDAFKADRFRESAEMCTLLVLIKFQAFMKKAAAQMTELKFPLLVTAHDFDLIAEFGPNSAD
jgi:hypothetical protein